jgi:hypothetical protein
MSHYRISSPKLLASGPDHMASRASSASESVSDLKIEQTSIRVERRSQGETVVKAGALGHPVPSALASGSLRHYCFFIRRAGARRLDKQLVAGFQPDVSTFDAICPVLGLDTLNQDFSAGAGATSWSSRGEGKRPKRWLPTCSCGTAIASTSILVPADGFIPSPSSFYSPTGPFASKRRRTNGARVRPPSKPKAAIITAKFVHIESHVIIVSRSCCKRSSSSENVLLIPFCSLVHSNTIAPIVAKHR